MHTSKIKTVSQNILLAIIALVPIIFLPPSVMTLESLKTFLYLITGVIFSLGIIIHKIKQDSFFVTKNIFVLSIFGVIFSALLSTILSNNIAISLFGRQISEYSFFGMFSLFALSYAVYSSFQDVSEKMKLALTLYISGVVVVVLHLLSIVVPFFPTFGFFVNNTVNTLGRWYDLGLFSLFIALSSILVLQFLSSSKKYRIIGWVGYIAGLLVMILTNSFFILALGVIFSLLYIVLNVTVRHEFDVKKKISYEALIILIISVIFILIGGKIGVLLDSAFGLQSSEVRPSVSATYMVSKDVIMHNPIAGVGLDRFDVAWLQYRPIESNLTQFWDTDFRFGFSTVLSTPITQGIVGILAWILFASMSVYFAFKLLFIKTTHSELIFINAYSVLGFLFSLIVLFVYVPSIVLFATLFVFLGLFASNLKDNGLISFKEVQISLSSRISFLYIFVLVLLIIGFVYIGYIHISQYASRVMFDNATSSYNKDGNLQVLESRVLNSQFVYNSDMYSRALTEIGLIRIGQIVQDSAITQEQAVSQFSSALRATIGYAQNAIAYDSQSYANRTSLMNVYKSLIPYGVADAKTEALSLADTTAQLTPNNPTLSLEKARIYTLSKEYDSAIQEIKNALELKSNYVDAVFLLSQIQVEKGEIDQAINSIQIATQVNSYNPQLRFQLGLLFYNKEKYNDAVIAFENAVKLSPSFANAKYFLGLSYYKNNRTGDAILVFENLATQAPESQEVKLILENLKAGKDPFNGIQPPLDNKPEQREELPLKDKEEDTASKKDADTDTDTDTKPKS